MKFVESTDLTEISEHLCFASAESQIVGSVDLYTTKPAASDRKLQRALDAVLDARVPDDDETLQLEAETAINAVQNLKLAHTPPTASSIIGTPLSPPPPPQQQPQQPLTDLQADSAVPIQHSRSRRLSSGLSTSASSALSPFGPMELGASRKQYAYLISVLNANDPDRDFSALAPELFQRERSISRVANTFSSLLVGLGQRPPANMWEVIDKQIDLKVARVFSLELPEQFLADEPGVQWMRMWFFFNKRRKRVIFIYLKALRVYSPSAKPRPDIEEDDDGHAEDEETEMSVLGDLE